MPPASYPDCRLYLFHILSISDNVFGVWVDVFFCCNCEVFLVAIVKFFCRQHSAKNTTVNSQCAEMLRGKTRLGKHPDKENYITAMIGAKTNTKSNQMKSKIFSFQYSSHIWQLKFNSFIWIYSLIATPLICRSWHVSTFKWMGVFFEFLATVF